MWDKMIGPATLVYLVSATFAAIWWAASVSARIDDVERKILSSASTADRLTRVETILLNVDKQLDRIDSKLDERR
jgi:hypothetical protein